MPPTELHALLLSQAFERVLGVAEVGSMAYVRCLTGDIVEALAAAPEFSLQGWKVWRVAGEGDHSNRTLTADRAVEMREDKSDPTLLLVDTANAGAGMEGIYNAAREVKEAELFDEAIRLAAHEVTRRLSRECREFAERAVKKARSRGRRVSVSTWSEFDFLARSAAENKHPGEFLYLLGLWPVKHDKRIGDQDSLEISFRFVNRLLGTASAASTPAARIEALKLLKPTDEQVRSLEAFLRSAAVRPLFLALPELADKPSLWVNALLIEGAAHTIHSIELVSWRNRNGKLVRVSGLTHEGSEDDPPVLILRHDPQRPDEYSKLEIHWKARPDHLEKGAVEYRVAIVTDMEEEIASREVSHSAKRDEKCRFTNDDFSTLSDDALISAKVTISVIGNDSITPQDSEEFIIRFGQPPEQEKGGVGKKFRTFSEGLIELDRRDLVAELAVPNGNLPEDAKGFVLLRTPQKGRSYRVFRPSLIREVENHWAAEDGAIGRWRVKVRASGARAGTVEFVPFSRPDISTGSLWEKAEAASRRMAERFGKSGGGVAQIYDEKMKGFDTVVKGYLLSWAALFDSEDFAPSFALFNTVEVQSLSGRTIGLIVLPNHPLRVAWHVAYDNLVLHARFEQNLLPKIICGELQAIDGAMFPTFLPGLDGESTFVFADTLGFHATGMVLDRDKEPKAAVALLARALGESETADSAPTVGKQSAEILGKEIIKYLECHPTSEKDESRKDRSRLLHIHALRPGDGMTVARSLGKVCKDLRKPENEDSESEEEEETPTFVLELYPSESQRGISGRFISEACEKRRSGAGVLPDEDRWMLESLTFGQELSVPRLRWARRDEQTPKSAAHLAAAFDTFESRVVLSPETRLTSTRPLSAFGLLSFYERLYVSHPSPLWESYVPPNPEGEKHPSDPTHTRRLLDLQRGIQKAVTRGLGGAASDLPVLHTEISPEKADDLRALHALCDWVITVDRNAGIEYFDSPMDNKEIFDAYVIDCVPEREDLGCLQLITSTSNLDEVRNLLDHALDQMGLSRSLRNAEFLLWHLKALSGRLAIRLTGQKAATGELIALALAHANCREAQVDDRAWTALANGFFVPVDDVRDLLPRLSSEQKKDGSEEKETRPDMIHISLGSRDALLFRFVEVKYRRHLRAVRSPGDLERIRHQTENFRRRWEDWYFDENLSSAQRAVRRAKLARVLRFYADKARRHYLGEDVYRSLISEIDRMIASGASYSAGGMQQGDRGFVFCPEFSGPRPLEISPTDWDTQIFLFGPGQLPDSGFRSATIRPNQMPDMAHNSEDASVLPSDAKLDTVSEVLVTQVGQESRPADVSISIPSNTLTTEGQALKIRLGEDMLANVQAIWEPSTKGHPHLLVVGQSGMGKTTCLINVCIQLWKQGV